MDFVLQNRITYYGIRIVRQKNMLNKSFIQNEYVPPEWFGKCIMFHSFWWHHRGGHLEIAVLETDMCHQNDFEKVLFFIHSGGTIAVATSKSLCSKRICATRMTSKMYCFSFILVAPSRWPPRNHCARNGYALEYDYVLWNAMMYCRGKFCTTELDVRIT